MSKSKPLTPEEREARRVELEAIVAEHERQKAAEKAAEGKVTVSPTVAATANSTSEVDEGWDIVDIALEFSGAFGVSGSSS